MCTYIVVRVHATATAITNTQTHATSNTLKTATVIGIEGVGRLMVLPFRTTHSIHTNTNEHIRHASLHKQSHTNPTDDIHRLSRGLLCSERNLRTYLFKNFSYLIYSRIRSDWN